MRMPRDRSGRRPALALLKEPFRPFFLAGAVWAVVAMAIWLALAHGAIGLPPAMSPRDWHAHEMLYGYVSGVAGGFLLTTVPKWTGRVPLSGWPLFLMLCLWVAGRLALAIPSVTGRSAAAVIDLAFLPAVGAVALADVIATRTWRDLRVLAPVGVLLAGDVVFHLAAARGDAVDVAIRIGIAGTIALIVVVGGRAVPGYTRMLLLQRDLLRGESGRLPHPFSRLDAASIALAVAALAAWIARPGSGLTGALMLAAAAAHVARSARWVPRRAIENRVILMLHLGYGFVPVGFALLGLAALWPAGVPIDAGVHAWTAGAIGVMTLAVMIHLTLRHCEGRIVVSRATELIGGAATLAAVCRILAAIVAGDVLRPMSAGLWIAAFALFACAHGPRLARTRGSPKNVV
jgi:uncharacterized protein involved in response to NO